MHGLHRKRSPATRAAGHAEGLRRLGRQRTPLGRRRIEQVPAGIRARMRPYWRDGLSMSLAVGVIGVTFGVCAEAAGFSLPRIVAMSVFVFAGQFAVVGVIDSGGAAAAAVGSALLLASRNALYGPMVRQFLPSSLLGRITGAHFVSDQSTAIAVAQTDRRDASGAFWFTGVTLWLCWNMGSVVGAKLGPVMGTPDRWGLGPRWRCCTSCHLRCPGGRPAAYRGEPHGRAGCCVHRSGRGAGHLTRHSDPVGGGGAGPCGVSAGPLEAASVRRHRRGR